MSEYEGKTYWRPYNRCTLADLLYYEAIGEMLPPDIRKSIIKSSENHKNQEEPDK